MKKTVALILIFCILVNLSDMSAWAEEDASGQVVQEMLNEYDPWDGVTTESVYETNTYRITFSLLEYWESGYNASIKIENIGDVIIENWCMAFDLNNTISNIWNASLYHEEENYYVIKNLGWNQDIAVDENIEFGFGGTEEFRGFPTEYHMLGEMIEVDTQDFLIEYYINSDSEYNFTGSLRITNNTNYTFEDWKLEFDFKETILEIWNGALLSQEDSHYIVDNAGYNANIEAGQTIFIGFIGSGNGIHQEPFNYKLYQYCINGTVDEEKEPDGEQDEKVAVTVNCDAFIYNEYGKWYVVDSKIEQLSGSLSGYNKVQNCSYVVKDIKGNIIKADDFPVEKNWIITDFGLTIGYNELTITAGTDSEGEVKYSVIFMNYDTVNMDGILVDLIDSDGDGFNNYYEDILGTDKNLADTDGDGLSDFDEIIKTGTNPLKRDTDQNGISDAEEDADSDGLNNVSEIEGGTDCLRFDTDGDKLSDGDEILKYHTNPLEQDSDRDGLKDGEESILGFDPMNPDTDADGVPDGRQIIAQTCKQEIDTARKGGVNSVAVSLECNGYIDNRVTILDTYNIDMRSSEVVGLIGVPVEISTDVEFEEADTVFSYDESVLGDTEEDNLCIMWYDEKMIIMFCWKIQF